MHTATKFWCLLALIFLGISDASSAVSDSLVTLNPAMLPAAGQQQSILNTSHFGRYALIAKSAQGTALQLIDRMAGPGAVHGTAGKQDGRIDAFLDRGAYKLLIHAHPKGTGDVKLSARAFDELNIPQAPRLLEYKTVSTALADFQQRSYWLEIQDRRSVAIEAAGRSLADLRLWKDGNWLTDITPEKSVAEPRMGQPLNVRRLAADLNPGLYLLTAYGGPSQPWAETSDAHPLHLRMGIPVLAEAGRQRYIASPFGIDRWRTPKKTNYFRLELPKAESAALRVSGYNDNHPFSESGKSGRINKKSLPPVTEINTVSRNHGYYLITVKREAGKPYLLQHFNAQRYYRFKGSSNYWISTLHAGHGEDSVDATALLTVDPPHGKEKLARSRAIKPEHGWRRRFNLQESLTLHLEISKRGNYIIDGKGAKARYRVEPFLIHKPRNYEAPEFESGGHPWPLDPGFYTLTVNPARKGKGVLNLSIHRQFGSNKPKRQSTAQTAVRFPRVRLRSRHAYVLYRNQQPGVKAGLVLRRLPIDLSKSLPVMLEALKTLEVPVKIPGAGRLTAMDETGKALSITVDGGRWRKSQNVSAGLRRIKIYNRHDAAVHFTLAWAPAWQEAPLPPISARALGQIPRFPVLAEKHPDFFDLGRQESKTFRVEVNTPALYRLQSSGLLQTEGNLRTRTIPSLMRRANNGTGRNFLIQQYLREGDYQLTVTPQGKTRGHLGLELVPARLHSGGLLTDGTPARFSLPAGEGLVYEFDIAKTGRYRLRTLGLNRSFRMRLEDAGNWPLLPPGEAADFSRTFTPGRYRLVILPSATNSRAVSLLEHLPPPLQRQGHGPHTLPLNQQVRHRWLEPEKGEERLPDQWSFSLSAPVDVTLRLSDEMSGLLQQSEKTIEIPPRRTWSGRLAAGNYQLAVKSVRPDNRLEYTLKLDAKQMFNGQSRQVNAPAEIFLAVGESGLTELASFGNQDVRARLYDDKGQLLAQNDDRADDWNFHIARKLPAGFYRLKVEPIGDSAASTRVEMRMPRTVEEAPLMLPAAVRVKDNDLHSYPLRQSSKGQVLLAAADSRDSAGIVLEEKLKPSGWRATGAATGINPRLTAVLDEKRLKSSGWRTTGTAAGINPRLTAVLDEKRSYRLRLWSIDRRGAEIILRCQTLAPEPITEREFTDVGAAFQFIDEIEPPMGIAAVKPERPGVFRADMQGGTWGVRGQLNETDDLMVANAEILWLTAAPDKGREKTLRAERVKLKHGEEVQLTLPPRERSRIDLTPGNGPLLVLAESRMGQPGAACQKTVDIHTHMGVAANSAIAVELEPQTPIAALWNAGDPDAPLPVRVRQFSYAPPESKRMAFGANDILLSGMESKNCMLPTGAKHIRLVLPAAAAAVFVRAGEVIGVRWSGAKSTVESIYNQADRLLLLHTDDKQVHAAVTITSSETAFPRLTPDIVFKRRFPAAGALNLDAVLDAVLRDGEKFRLRLHGAEAVFVSKQGEVRRGRDFDLSKNGRLTIRHGPGLLAAWLENARQNPWQKSAGHNTVTVRPPARILLQGAAMRLRIKQAKAAMLHLNTAAAVIMYIQNGNRPGRTEIFPEGAAAGIYVPPKVSEIILQAAGADNLSGSAELFRTEITAIGEGPGPKLRLAPGDTRLFSFTLEHDGPIGMGVRAPADIANCRLLDAAGKVLGEGAVQMHQLVRGEYLLAVEIPADAVPVEIQPVLAGIDLPDSGPPEKIIRKYLNIAGLKK